MAPRSPRLLALLLAATVVEPSGKALPRPLVTAAGRFARMAGECAPTNATRSCRLGHGTGHALCSEGGSWGSCRLISCDTGYTLSRNSSCVAAACRNGSWVQPCRGDHGEGFETCAAADRLGGPVGGCLLTQCDAGYHYSGGRCDALLISADPPFVALGGNSTLRWAVPGATGCRVTSDGVTLWDRGTNATVNTAQYGPSTKDTTYQLDCDMRDGTTQSGSVTVHVPVQVRPGDFSFRALRGANIMDQASTSAIAWFSNTPDLAPIAANQLGLNFFRLNLDLSQAVDEGASGGVGGGDDFMRALSDALDACSQHHIQAILVFGIEPSHQYREDSLCRCPSPTSLQYVRPLAQQIIAVFGAHPAVHSFELLNEAFSTMGDGNKCDHAGVREFVVGLYELVRTLAPAVPTTVVRQCIRRHRAMLLSRAVKSHSGRAH